MDPGRETAAGRALASVWARMQIADLENRATWAGAEEVAPDIREIALAYSQSLLLTDHVARRYGERVLFEMIAGCAAGDAPAETFERLTRVPLDLALQDLAESL